MLCQFQVYSKVVRFYIYMYLFFFKFFSHLGYYRILSRVPCAIQQVLVGYLFEIQQCVHVNPNLPISPYLPPFPLVTMNSLSKSGLGSICQIIHLIVYLFTQFLLFSKILEKRFSLVFLSFKLIYAYSRKWAAGRARVCCEDNGYYLMHFPQFVLSICI